MKSLMAFKEWCEDKGHYAALNMVKNYLGVLDERANNTSEDNQEAGDRRPQCNQLDNCE
jgi:hypothetical protein